MPAERHFSLSPSIAFAVKAIAGVRVLRLEASSFHLTTGLKTIHFRHHAIHKNKVILMILKKLHRFHTVIGYNNICTIAFDHGRCNHLIDGVVLH